MDDSINIVFGSSKELALFSMVTIKSLFVNNPGERISIYYYYHEPMDDILIKLDHLVSESGGHFNPMFVGKERISDFSVDKMDWWHTAIWYRYFCVEDLHDKLDRVMILGTDVVVQKNIKDFYYRDMGNCSLMAVLDMGYYSMYPARPHKEYGLEKEDYVNTDIVVIDLKKAYGRIDARSMFYKYRDNKYWALDQDVINFDFRNELMVEKDMHFNFMPLGAQKIYGKRNVREEQSKATFVHLAVVKPWNEYDEDNSHDLWYEYVKLLPDNGEFMFDVVKHMGKHIKEEKSKHREEIDQKNRHIYKMDKLYWICDKLYTSCKSGIVKEKIESLCSDSIAIYGCGKLGKQLSLYCKENGISIAAFIDSGAQGIVEGISVVNTSELSNNDHWDTIIVTPIYVFDDIANLVKTHCKKVISLEDIV